MHIQKIAGVRAQPLQLPASVEYRPSSLVEFIRCIPRKRLTQLWRKIGISSSILSSKVAQNLDILTNALSKHLQL